MQELVPRSIPMLTISGDQMKRLGPFTLKWYSRQSWFLWYRGTFLAKYYAKASSGFARFKLSVGKLTVEYY